mgnify:CR=1 FL=1
MNPDERACPYCGEAIKMVAIKCKHCMASVKSCVPEIPTKNQKENTEVKQIEAKKDQSNNINTFDFIKNEDKFKSSKFIKNIAKILTFVWCVVIYFYYADLSTYIGIFTSNEIQGTVKQVSIVMFLMSCLFLIGTLCFFARLHGAGFRWFTKYKKDTMPDFTWRYLIQIFSNLFASILMSFAFIFVNFDYNNTINYLLIFCILTVVLYGIALIMVSKLTFGITLSESWRASTVPILVLCLLLSPAIYIYGSLAIQQNKMQEIVEQNTNTNKEQSSEIYNQKNYEENYSNNKSYESPKKKSLSFKDKNSSNDISPKFDNYLTEIYNGPRANINIVTPLDKKYVSRILQTKSQPINFAGEYVLSMWGCGTGGCLMGVAVNARSGQVVELPGTVCCWKGAGDNVIFKINSRLLVLAGLIGEDGQHGAHYYQLNNGKFTYIKTIPVEETNSEE